MKGWSGGKKRFGWLWCSAMAPTETHFSRNLSRNQLGVEQIMLPCPPVSRFFKVFKFPLLSSLF